MRFKKTLLGSNSWASLEKRIAALPDEHWRGEAFEEFCGIYLRLVPKYNIKHVWSRGEYPRWLIERLRLTGQKDQGIDLIAQTKDREIWAIQAKFRSDRSGVVSYGELATFLAISDNADYRLIISNTKKLPDVVRRRSRSGEVLVDRLDELDKAFFAALEQYVRKQETPTVKPFTPKPHQRKALSVICHTQ